MFALALAAATQQASASAKIAAAPRIVRVDVIATDAGGRSVGSLQPGDFEISEDGTPRSIDEARFIRIDNSLPSEDDAGPEQSEASERAAAARPNTRLFAIFLDEYHVGAANSGRVRDALTRFVDETLGPRDLLAVMRPLDSIFAIQMTRSRGQAHEVLGAFAGRKGDYTPRNDYERNYFAGTPARVDQLRAQVTTSALNALAVHLGSLNSETRKTLVVVSEGLPRVDRRRGLESLPTIDSVIRSANRSNVSIYAVDPRESVVDAAGPADIADSLSALTAATDGLAIGSVADLSGGMRRIEADSNAYYLLSYTTTQSPDGRFHDVRVSIKQPGIRVRARKGYWAANPDDTLRADLLRPRPPPPLEPPARISPLVKPWFGVSRGAAGKTRVMFVWEPAPPVPGVRTRLASPSRVVLTALGPDGTALFEGSVLPAGPLRPDAADEVEARAVFDAPPGQLRLRMSIEDDSGQTIDSDVRQVAIRDLSAPVVLGTPEVLRARTARDFRALEGDPDAAPVAAREFSRTERLMIRVAAYAPIGSDLTLSAKLLNRKGQTMRNLAVQLEASPSTRHQIDLPLAALAAGQYLIEVAAKSAAGDVKDLLEFRVTN
ncbi:MAG: VWA domain-containing protein [Acidobacteriota bacterium]